MSVEEKKLTSQVQENRKKGSMPSKLFKGKTEGLEDAIFESGAVRHAAQFTKTVEALADYVQVKFNADVATAIRDIERPAILMPKLPMKKKIVKEDGTTIEEEFNEVEVFMWKKEYEAEYKRRREFEEKEKRVFPIILGQCSPSLRSQLEGGKGFEEICKNYDVVKLLKMIRGFSCRHDQNNDRIFAAIQSIRAFFNNFQKREMTNDEYLKEFQARWSTLDDIEVDIVKAFPGLLKQEVQEEYGKSIEDATEEEITATKMLLKKKIEGRTLLIGADRSRFGDLKDRIQLNMAMGNNNYPNSLEHAMNILNTHQRGNKNYLKKKKDGDQESELSFSQKPPVEDVTCYNCGDKGHYANTCPKKKKNIGAKKVLAQIQDGNFDEEDEEIEFTYHQVEKGDEWDYRILIDSQSTINIFKNKELLKNIQPSRKGCKIQCNTGMVEVKMKGMFGETPVWYHPDGVANILSLKSLKEKHHVTYDSQDEGGVFRVKTSKGEVKFVPHPNGLHYIDLRENNNIEKVLINTVESNIEGFTRKEVDGARKARDLQMMLGHPSNQDFRSIVHANLIANCPISENDITNAEAIFGKNLAGIRGKTTRRKPERVRTDYVRIPKEFIEMHRSVTLMADVMFVNKIAFLVTFSRGIGLITVEHLPTRNAGQLARNLVKVSMLYNRAGFKIQTILMDMEFDKVKPLLPHVIVNTSAAREHVGEVERKIRVIKERARACISTLPYKILPKIMIINLMHFCVFWLNMTPTKSSITDRYSPRELICRQRADAKLWCKLPFGAYAETHEDLINTNTMEPRTRPAICMGPTRNLNGSTRFMCLTTGRKIIRRNFTALPMPDSVIKRIEEIAREEQISDGLVFQNRIQQESIDENDEELIEMVDEEMEPYPAEQDVNYKPVFIDENILDGGTMDDNECAAEAAENCGTDGVENMAVDIDDNPNDEQEITEEDEIVINEEETLNDGTDDHITGVDSDNTTNQNQGHQQHNVDHGSKRIRNKNPRYYNDDMVNTSISTEEEEKVMATVLHYTFAQNYSLNKGLKIFGKRGEEATTKELKQLHEMDAFIPLNPSTLTQEQKERAIASLIFLTEKRDGTIKARQCADGRKQRKYTDKSDSASPTVSNEAIFITCAIDAKEGRDVAIIDLPGAFLHATNDEDVTMSMKGRLAEMMGMLAPQTYRKYISVEKGQQTLYVKVHKALYGMLRSALLFYRKLRADLEHEGFVINPYDPCVANKMINGAQMTITWHVDDLKISHVDPWEVTKMIKWFGKIYGNIKVSRGKVHNYLGMQLDYRHKGEVRMSMKDYVKEVIESFPEEIGTKVAATPAAEYLFEVRPEKEAKLLPEEQAVVFHHIVAKLLFMANRTRRDIQTAVAFLTTRVKRPDEDDWGKLKRVIKYLNGTRNLELRMSVDNIGSIKWYVDASYAIHDDCKGHTGALMTFGKGSVTSISRKQKLNGKSSTEAELIGVDEVLPQILWTRYFIESQGYEVASNTIFQDNKSAIILENKGKEAGSKRTKHIKVRYFFIKDKIENGEVDVKYCPTEKMWSDVLTKPLQGQAFRAMRSQLMNCPEDYHEELLDQNRMKADICKTASSQGCVGTREKTVNMEKVQGNEISKGKNTSDLRNHTVGRSRNENQKMSEGENSKKRVR